LKILFAADVSIACVSSGAERVLYEQATRLASGGNTVHLLTRYVPGNHKREHEDINGVTEWRYQADTKDPVRFVFDTFKNGGHLFKLLHRDISYDCLFLHQPMSACAVLLSRKCAGIKKIYICHSLWHEEYLSRISITSGVFKRLCLQAPAQIRKWMEKRALNRSDGIIALSRYTKGKLQNSHEISGDKVSIVPGGVDLERFTPEGDRMEIRRRLGFPVNGIILFTLRNLEPRMGLSELLHAMRNIVSHIPDVHLVVGGDGPLKQSG